MAADHVPFGGDQHEHPGGDVRRPAVILARRVDQLGPQPRLVRGQLRAGRAAPRGERPQHAVAKVPQPPRGITVPDPAFREIPFQLPSDPLRNVIGAGPLHHGQQRSRNHEDRAAHAEHPDEPALGVQLLIDRLGGGGRDAGARRQVNGHRIGRVQRDHGVRGGADGRGGDGQPVP